MTCSTGLACMQLFKHGARTIHSTFGLMDGHFSLKELQQRVWKNDGVQATVRAMDVLIIDEISLVSALTLEQVECVVRTVKGNDMLMGGIQTIFCGDYLQLPPVPNQAFGDEGVWCFKSPIFHTLVPHQINLLQPRRADSGALSTAVHELAWGVLSESTSSFLNSLSSKLQKYETKLVAKNDEVDRLIARAILEMGGPISVFISEDSGDVACLRRCHVEKVSHHKSYVQV